MDFLEFCRILTVAASCVMAIGIYIQAWKIWKTHSAKDFSVQSGQKKLSKTIFK